VAAGPGAAIGELPYVAGAPVKGCDDPGGRIEAPGVLNVVGGAGFTAGAAVPGTP